MNQLALKFAVSTLVLGSTMVGCSLDRQVYGVSPAAAKAPRAQQDASRFYDQARAALQRGDHGAALGFAESAVEIAPRDSAYRMLLADLYLKNGRFASAEATYRDVLELQPDHVRAGLTLALSQIAQGKNGAALGQLELFGRTASPSDLGLAYALAGQPERAIELLEPAARAENANGRVRQNLALAYALAGDWQRARTVAAQDVAPDELAPRLQQWAAMARPEAPWTQVAALLNVTPAEDPGQPVRLALAPPPAPAEVVMAEFAPAPEPVTLPAEPVRFASIEPVTIAPPLPPAAEPEFAEIRYAAAAETLVRPEPVAIAAPAAPPAPLPKPVFERAAPKPAPVRTAATGVHNPQRASGRYVVQIGAFSNVRNAERAWAEAERRYGFGEDRAVTTTFEQGGRTLHRVAVAGFDSQAGAARACQSVKAKGGACFVREVAGDTPIRLAWRNAGRSAA